MEALNSVLFTKAMCFDSVGEERYAENYHPVTALVTAGDGNSLELDVDTCDNGSVNIVISDHMGSTEFMAEWSTWANVFE